jgi:hypothetical protein
MDKFNTCHLVLQIVNIALYINTQLTNKNSVCI